MCSAGHDDIPDDVIAALHDGLRQVPVPPASSRFDANVLAALSAQPVTRTAWLREMWSMAATAALCCLLGTAAIGWIADLSAPAVVAVSRHERNTAGTGEPGELLDTLIARSSAPRWRVARLAGVPESDHAEVAR
jgi:hypothetical protein